MCWLLRDGKPAQRTYAAKVLDALGRPDIDARVPVTWALEVADVIAKAEARGQLREAQSEAFLEMLGDLDIAVDAATFSKATSDTLAIARRYRLSAYDASYLELALRAGLPLKHWGQSHWGQSQRPLSSVNR